MLQLPFGNHIDNKLLIIFFGSYHGTAAETIQTFKNIKHNQW